MTISELINDLMGLKCEYGDMPVILDAKGVAVALKVARNDAGILSVVIEGEGDSEPVKDIDMLEDGEPVTLVELDAGATMPRRAHADDVGYDVTACSVEYEDYCGSPMDREDGENVHRVVIDTGVHVRPPRGYHFELLANSRLAKLGYCIPNGVGLIDPGFTGAMKMLLLGVNPLPRHDVERVFAPGKVCGQLVLRKTHGTEFRQVEKLPETERGNGGFGSTAKGGEA